MGKDKGFFSRVIEDEGVNLKNVVFGTSLPSNDYTNREMALKKLLDIPVGIGKQLTATGFLAFGGSLFWVPCFTFGSQRTTVVDRDGVSDNVDYMWPNCTLTCCPFSHHVKYKVLYNKTDEIDDLTTAYVGNGVKSNIQSNLPDLGAQFELLGHNNGVCQLGNVGCNALIPEDDFSREVNQDAQTIKFKGEYHGCRVIFCDLENKGYKPVAIDSNTEAKATITTTATQDSTVCLFSALYLYYQGVVDEVCAIPCCAYYACCAPEPETHDHHHGASSAPSQADGMHRDADDKPDESKKLTVQ